MPCHLQHATHRRPTSGLTVVELTVVLGVLVTLALTLTAPVLAVIANARGVRARTDCHVLMSAISQFHRDTGFFPQWMASQAGGPGPHQGRLQLLGTNGNLPLEEQSSAWSTGQSGLLVDQLVDNVPGYTKKSATSPLGWNGPYYLPSDLDSDPWGHRYVVNIGLIDASPGVLTKTGRPKSAVWVLSAGPNGMIDTPFFQPLTAAVTTGGDDIGYRIQ
jgi:hypothetical protein